MKLQLAIAIAAAGVPRQSSHNCDERAQSVDRLSVAIDEIGLVSHFTKRRFHKAVSTVFQKLKTDELTVDFLKRRRGDLGGVLVVFQLLFKLVSLKGT